MTNTSLIIKILKFSLLVMFGYFLLNIIAHVFVTIFLLVGIKSELLTVDKINFILSLILFFNLGFFLQRSLNKKEALRGIVSVSLISALGITLLSACFWFTILATKTDFLSRETTVRSRQIISLYKTKIINIILSSLYTTPLYILSSVAGGIYMKNKTAHA
jgi:hypothetical protein